MYLEKNLEKFQNGIGKISSCQITKGTIIVCDESTQQKVPMCVVLLSLCLGEEILEVSLTSDEVLKMCTTALNEDCVRVQCENVTTCRQQHATQASWHQCEVA